MKSHTLGRNENESMIRRQELYEREKVQLPLKLMETQSYPHRLQSCWPHHPKTQGTFIICHFLV